MTDMIEKVARALCCPSGCKQEGLEHGLCKRGLYIRQAEIAIAAVREPTEAMIEVGAKAAYEASRHEADWGRWGSEAVQQSREDEGSIADVFRNAMRVGYPAMLAAAKGQGDE